MRCALPPCCCGADGPDALAHAACRRCCCRGLNASSYAQDPRGAPVGGPCCPGPLPRQAPHLASEGSAWRTACCTGCALHIVCSASRVVASGPMTSRQKRLREGQVPARGEAGAVGPWGQGWEWGHAQPCTPPPAPPTRPHVARCPPGVPLGPPGRGSCAHGGRGAGADKREAAAARVRWRCRPRAQECGVARSGGAVGGHTCLPTCVGPPSWARTRTARTGRGAGPAVVPQSAHTGLAARESRAGWRQPRTGRAVGEQQWLPVPEHAHDGLLLARQLPQLKHLGGDAR